jgi:hypothetical protein
MTKRARRRLVDLAEADAELQPEDPVDATEVPLSESVDGDYNGAPELASVEASANWQGSDTVDAAERSALGDEHPPEPESLAADLANIVTARRAAVCARLDEARAAGLEDTFASALAVSEPGAGGAPDPFDEDVLRDQIRLLDAAIAALERA